MKINVKGEEIELVYSFRSSIYFEEIAGHKLDYDNMSATDLAKLFYVNVYATMQKLGMPPVTYLEFQDVIDDNGGDICIYKFSNWYADVQKRNWELINSIEEEPDEKKQAAKKKI